MLFPPSRLSVAAFNQAAVACPRARSIGTVGQTCRCLGGRLGTTSYSTICFVHEQRNMTPFERIGHLCSWPLWPNDPSTRSSGCKSAPWRKHCAVWQISESISAVYSPLLSRSSLGHTFTFQLMQLLACLVPSECQDAVMALDNFTWKEAACNSAQPSQCARRHGCREVWIRRPKPNYRSCQPEKEGVDILLLLAYGKY